MTLLFPLGRGAASESAAACPEEARGGTDKAAAAARLRQAEDGEGASTAHTGRFKWSLQVARRVGL